MFLQNLRPNRALTAALLLEIAAAVFCCNAFAQPRSEPATSLAAMPEPVTDATGLATWLQRLVGRFRYEGHVEALFGVPGCGPPPTESESQQQPFCTAVKGMSDCIEVGDGPGVQCIIGVTWQELFDVDFEAGTVTEVPGFVPYMDPAMDLHGLDPGHGELNHLMVNNKSLAEGGYGSIRGDRATFTAACVKDPAFCRRVTRIHAVSDARIVEMLIDIESLVQGAWEPVTKFVLTLRRIPRDEGATQAAGMGRRMSEVAAPVESSDEEQAETDASAFEDSDSDESMEEEVEAPVVEPPIASMATAPQRAGVSAAGLDTLDEVVAENERERQRKASAPRSLSNPDIITVNRKGAIAVRVQSRDAPPELNFRQSAARQARENVRPPMQLQPDRLIVGAKRPTLDVALEFAAGIKEADGLPAVIPFGPSTSLFNMDYVRLRNPTRQTMITMRNVVDPETRRCRSSLSLSNDAAEFPNRFILMADNSGECNRTVKKREGDLLFADGVPERLRQQLREFYEPIYNRFAQDLGSEPGLLFVVWQPDSARDSFRLVHALDRTALLLFNGPSWEQDFTVQQREALWEEFALEQIERRIPAQGEPDAIAESAVNYLLELARSGRQRATKRALIGKLPGWIARCAYDMSVRAGMKNPPRVLASYDCGLVLHFVYDAVARAKSGGDDTVHRTWRTLLADSFRRGQSGFQPADLIDSSADARRIVQGLLNGSVDWNGFSSEMGKLGVQLRIAPGQFGPDVQVLSLAYFLD